MKEHTFSRDLLDGRTPVIVGQKFTNKKLGNLIVITAGEPYPVDGDMDDDMGTSGGGFRAGTRFMRQDYTVRVVK